MTDAPWDEGPVSALRARIQELEGKLFRAECDAAGAELIAAQGIDARLISAQADRDRAVEAVRTLRIALEGLVESEIPKPCWCAFRRDIGQKHSLACLAARRAWAATAEWDAP